MSRQRLRALFAGVLASGVGVALVWVVACGSTAGAPEARRGTRAPGGRPTPEKPVRGAKVRSVPDKVSVGESGERPVPQDGLERYLSPLTPEGVEQLRAIVRASPGRKDDVFAKVGDSATVNRAFMKCFSDGTGVTFGSHEALAPVIERFRAGRAGLTDPFRRKSLAARVGWSTHHVLAGRPSPLLAEVRAISPRYAFVLFGGNELKPEENMKRYASRIETIVAQLTSRGVIPILHTLFPRNGDPEADVLVPRYNLLLRAIAEGHHLPLIDLYGASLTLPNRGIASDGMHPSAPVRERLVRGCDLSAAGVRFGQNMRNLLSMMMLARLTEVVADGAEAPDPSAPGLAGAGSTREPFRIEEFPFAYLGSTVDGAKSEIDAYSGCEGSGDESGPEQLYRFTIDEPTEMRFTLFYDGDRDLDLHLLGTEPTGAACRARDDRDLTAALEPGTYHLAVDSFGGLAQAGSYVLLVTKGGPGVSDNLGTRPP